MASTNSINGSALFNGANFLTVNGNTGTAMETVDFTWECWVYPTSSLEYQVFLDSRENPLEGGDTTGYYFGTNINTLTPIVYTNGIVLEATGNITLNEWNHVALTRSGGTINIWINGVNRGSTANETNLTFQRIFIGGDAISNGLNLTGNLSNIRITKGVAVYTANFTKPTTNFTVTQSANVNGNPSAAITEGQTQLLLNTNFGTEFLTDTSTNNFTVVNNGGVISSNYEPFTPIPGPTPATTYTPEELTGAGTPATQAFAATSTYTITVTNKNIPGSCYLVFRSTDPSNTLYFSGSTFSLTNATAVVNDVQGNHFGVVVDPQGTTTIEWTPAVNIPLGDITIQATGGIGVTIDGVIAANPLLYYDPSDPASYPGTGTTIDDLSGNGLDGTMSNITFTTPYFSYNGTTSQISVPDNALLEPGSGDWTIETWINHSVIAGAGRIIIGKTDGGLASDWGYGLRTNSAGSTYFEVGNGTTSANSPSSTLSIDTWYQVVGVWTNVASNSIALYINGALIGSNSHAFTSVKNTTSPLYLGSFNGGQFAQWFDGKMGIVRMYNRALSTGEVLQNYNVTKGIYGL